MVFRRNKKRKSNFDIYCNTAEAILSKTVNISKNKKRRKKLKTIILLNPRPRSPRAAHVYKSMDQLCAHTKMHQHWAILKQRH